MEEVTLITNWTAFKLGRYVLHNKQVINLFSVKLRGKETVVKLSIILILILIIFKFNAIAMSHFINGQ